MSERVQLSTYRHDGYRPGRGFLVRAVWLLVNRALFRSSMPWPSVVKRGVLRFFGARVGRGVVIKPRVNIKYPWNVSIGSASWIGEDSWFDSLGHITVGSDVCVSQGCLIETGNHDWSRTSFDLVVKEVVLEDGSWAAARSVLLPGSRLSTHSVLTAGGVLSKTSEPYSIYSGNPAVKVGVRRLNCSPGAGRFGGTRTPG